MLYIALFIHVFIITYLIDEINLELYNIREKSKVIYSLIMAIWSIIPAINLILMCLLIEKALDILKNQ